MPGVVVLGMHRSGTSVATRLVSLMGFSPGRDGDLLPAHPDNPAGYWENASLVGANDEILGALESDWSRPPRLEELRERRPEVEALRPVARSLVASALSADRWVWKDPRACLTLPFWLPLLGEDVSIVLIHRNPLEVAASLQARDGFDIPVGLALWERYVRSSLAAAEGRAVCVTSYERLVADPQAWCRRVADFLHCAPVDPHEVRAELRRSRISIDALSSDPSVSSAQRAIHAALEACDGSHDAFAPPPLPPETLWVQALLDERWRNLRSAHEVAAAEAARRHAETMLTGIEASRSYRALSPLRAVWDLLAAVGAHPA
ncbi:MAG TPA: sulfotransferase [Gaiellaceae bacterium]|nr:sulfotransferase [Gaiellaceae bacterium]